MWSSESSQTLTVGVSMDKTTLKKCGKSCDLMIPFSLRSLEPRSPGRHGPNLFASIPSSGKAVLVLVHTLFRENMFIGHGD